MRLNNFYTKSNCEQIEVNSQRDKGSDYRKKYFHMKIYHRSRCKRTNNYSHTIYHSAN